MPSATATAMNPCGTASGAANGTASEADRVADATAADATGSGAPVTKSPTTMSIAIAPSLSRVNTFCTTAPGATPTMLITVKTPIAEIASGRSLPAPSPRSGTA